MGRGGYDLTDPKKARCSIAGEVLMMNRDKKKKNRQDAVTMKTSEDTKENLIRNKSTSIMATKKVMREVATKLEPATHY